MESNFVPCRLDMLRSFCNRRQVRLLSASQPQSQRLRIRLFGYGTAYFRYYLRSDSRVQRDPGAACNCSLSVGSGIPGLSGGDGHIDVVIAYSVDADDSLADLSRSLDLSATPLAASATTLDIGQLAQRGPSIAELIELKAMGALMMDQSGTRYLQRLMYSAEDERMVGELLPHCVALHQDAASQPDLVLAAEHVNLSEPGQRRLLRAFIGEHVLRMSQHMYACRVVQKCLTGSSSSCAVSCTKSTMTTSALVITSNTSIAPTAEPTAGPYWVRRL